MTSASTPHMAWPTGVAPVAVVMISLNEAHNMEAVLENLKGWAQEVFLVDSYSADDTVDIALRHGVHVVQRRFRGFGDQWNFALRGLPISAPWTMKLDPDERVSDELKREVVQRLASDEVDGYVCPIRLHFMGRPLPVRLRTPRIWRTGSVHFSAVTANEHAIVDGTVSALKSDIEHHDSPNLDHWFAKQNRYSTSEATAAVHHDPLSAKPRLFGSTLERRMWLKRHFWKIPGRYPLLFLYHCLVLGAWRAGRVGWIWSHLRVEVYRMWEYKEYEMRLLGRVPDTIPSQRGKPDARVQQYE